MFCPKCGNEVPEGLAFCGRCGNPISFQDAGSTQPIQADQVSDAGAAENLSEGIAPAKKKKKSKVIIPVVAVLLVAVIGAAAFATGGFGLLGDSGAELGDDIEASYEVEESEEPKESDTSTEADSSEDSSEEVDDTEQDASDDGIKDSVDDYTWEELSAISAEIAAASDEDEAIEIAKTYNLVNEEGTLNGTQSKTIRLTNGTEISVQIVGFAHDDKSDGSGKAGITFMFVDAIAKINMNSTSGNAGGWASSEMRSWLAFEGKELLPEELQNVIVAVNKLTNNVGETESTSSVTTTSDELWLFSYTELAGKSNASYAAILNAEGSQYKLFRDLNIQYASSNYILKKAYQSSASSYWWQRSPNPDGSKSFMRVDSSGIPNNSGLAYYSNAVVPGFCI